MSDIVEVILKGDEISSCISVSRILRMLRRSTKSFSTLNGTQGRGHILRGGANSDE